VENEVEGHRDSISTNSQGDGVHNSPPSLFSYVCTVMLDSITSIVSKHTQRSYVHPYTSCHRTSVRTETAASEYSPSFASFPAASQGAPSSDSRGGSFLSVNTSLIIPRRVRVPASSCVRPSRHRPQRSSARLNSTGRRAASRQCAHVVFDPDTSAARASAAKTLGVPTSAEPSYRRREVRKQRNLKHHGGNVQKYGIQADRMDNAIAKDALPRICRTYK
jgi:hypothetical protein